MAKAPEHIVAKEREKLAGFQAQKKALEVSLQELSEI